MTRDDFESVVQKEQKMVYSIAFNFFNNEATAEEVAQEVFLQLYKNLRIVEAGPHCIAWLRRTTIHRCIDTLRRASFRHEVPMDSLPDIPSGVPSTDPLLQESLRRLIASLPEKHRAVLILRFGEDMDIEEIAATLNMPVRTVWSHLQRGMKLVREKAKRCLKEMAFEGKRT